ncbi:MAG: molybdenum cofactor biosynthesis protein MoaE [Chloroflexi bacterium]|nr:molybdenum cofactor biosynthesis protein MoaE [Chloroflexota bacterium]
MSRWILDTPLQLEPLLAETEDPASGALVIFYGTVRNENDGQPVHSMTYEAHATLAEKVLAEIEQEALERFGVRRCRIQHRIGTLQLGETSVLIVVRAAHRDAAYRASRYAIDAIKQRAPIWKEEHYISGESRYLDGVPLQQKDIE